MGEDMASFGGGGGGGVGLFVDQCLSVRVVSVINQTCLSVL